MTNDIQGVSIIQPRTTWQRVAVSSALGSTQAAAWRHQWTNAASPHHHFTAKLYGGCSKGFMASRPCSIGRGISAGWTGKFQSRWPAGDGVVCRLLWACCVFNSANWRAFCYTRATPIAVLASSRGPQAACSTAAGPCPCLLPPARLRRAAASSAAPSSTKSRGISLQAHAAQRRNPAGGLGRGGGAPAGCCRRPACGGRPWPPRPQLPAFRD